MRAWHNYKNTLYHYKLTCRKCSLETILLALAIQFRRPQKKRRFERYYLLWYRPEILCLVAESEMKVNITLIGALYTNTLIHTFYFSTQVDSSLREEFIYTKLIYNIVLFVGML